MVSLSFVISIIAFLQSTPGIVGGNLLNSDGITDFDPNFTVSQLQLAQMSYCCEIETDKTFVPSTANVTKVIEASGGRAIVGYDTTTKTLFVSFRGSSDLRNWIENVQFFKTNPYDDLPDVAVEVGFNKWYNALKDAGLESALNDAATRFGTKSVSIQGHSAGGACAVLMAFEVKRNAFPGYSLSTVTTFGCPRVGNSDFTAAFSSLITSFESTRVTHYRDIVPHMPQMRLGYHHVYNEVYYNKESSEYKVCDSSGEDADCSNQCGPLHCVSVADHLLYMNVSLGSDSCVAQQ